MDVAICGGTGDIGEGLALRIAFDTTHDVAIGSREADRAKAKAREYEAELDSRGLDRTVAGDENAAVVGDARVVILAVPAYHVADTVESIAESLSDETILVSPAVGLNRDDAGVHYHPPPEGSVTERVAAVAPDGVPVVGAYHNLPAGRLADLDRPLEADTFLVGDDADAVDIVSLFTDAIEGLRPLFAGGLANSAEVESLTPLLINVAQHSDGIHDPAIVLK